MLLKSNVTSHPLYFMLGLNWQPNERKAEAVQQGYLYDKAQPDCHAVKMLRNTSEINAKRFYMSFSNSVTDSKRMDAYFYSLQRFFKSTVTYFPFLDWNNHQTNAAINQYKPCLFSMKSTNSYLPRRSYWTYYFQHLQSFHEVETVTALADILEWMNSKKLLLCFKTCYLTEPCMKQQIMYEVGRQKNAIFFISLILHVSFIMIIICNTWSPLSLAWLCGC